MFFSSLGTLFPSWCLGAPPRDRAALPEVARVLVSAATTMLHSTITTGSYILEKYSRSYPPNVSAQSQSQDLTAAQPEWQHFANPVISLTLDVKKSMDNKFESVRLRILWNMGMGHDGTPREITMVRTNGCIYALFDSRASSGRPRSFVVFWSRFSNSLCTRSTSQSCLSRSGGGNPLPISTYRASYITERTYHMIDLILHDG